MTLLRADFVEIEHWVIEHWVIEHRVVHAFVPNDIEDSCLSAGCVGALAGVSQHGVRLRGPVETGGRHTFDLRPILGLLLPTSAT